MQAAEFLVEEPTTVEKDASMAGGCKAEGGKSGIHQGILPAQTHAKLPALYESF